MARFKVILEYEGTRFSGWQIQNNARTIQGEILRVAQEIFQTRTIEIYGSGRTDAGVHALYQVAHLDVETVLAPEIIRMKLNDELPPDINIIEVEKGPKTFHARHDAVARSYLYQISRRRTAFGKRFVWWIKDSLDVSAMKSVLPLFEGMKNFQSFTADDPEEKSTAVLIERMRIAESGELILVRIEGSHFLWKMIRQMIGILAEVGRGKMKKNEIEQLLRTHSDKPARYTAPPSGLFLERVYYKGEKRLEKIEPVLQIHSESVSSR